SESDAGIGHVECRPVILTRVQHDEIDNESEAHAIRQVAEYAGQQQSARPQNAIIVARRAKEIKQHGDRRGAGQDYKEPAPKRAAFLQLTERDAAVLSVNQIERTANNGALLKSQTTHCPGLARLIH